MNRVCGRDHDQSTDLCRFSAQRLQNSINLRHCFILSSESVAETTELLSSVWLGSVVVVALDLRYKMAANSTPGRCLAEQRAILGKSFTRVQFPVPLKLQEAQLMLTTGSTRLAVSRGQQTWYHSTCYM